MNKHREIRAKRARAKHLKALRDYQDVKSSWVGDYLNVGTPPTLSPCEKFKDHGKYHHHHHK